MKSNQRGLKTAIIIGLSYFVVTILFTIIQWYIFGSGRGALLFFGMLNLHYFGFVSLFQIEGLSPNALLLIPLFNIIIAYFLITASLYITSKVRLEFKK